MAEVKKPVAVAKKTEETKAAEVETKVEAAAKKATAAKKTTAKKEAAPKAAAKKEAAPKAAAKKEAAPKAAAKKEAAPKKAAEVAVKIQFNGKEVDLDELKARVVEAAGNGAVAYFNVNDSKVYCTVNGEPKGDFEV